jgi:hypothetical protein
MAWQQTIIKWLGLAPSSAGFIGDSVFLFVLSFKAVLYYRDINLDYFLEGVMCKELTG